MAIESTCSLEMVKNISVLHFLDSDIKTFSDRLKIEGSNVINMDIPASNGVVQVVENIIEMGKMPT